MTTTNPYETPEGELVRDDDEGYCELGFFKASTRIGRIRYLSHAFLFSILMYALLIPSLFLMFTDNVILIGIASLMMFAVYVFFAVLIFISGIQRLHDLDRSGWFILFLLVPLLNIALAVYMLFWPGTEASNNFGKRPPPTKTWNWVCAFIIPALLIVGVIGASVIIPSFVNNLPNDSYGEFPIEEYGGE